MEISNLSIILGVLAIIVWIYYFTSGSIYVNTTCDWCGSNMRITRDLFRSNRDRGYGNYCCEQCELEANKITVKCDWCGTQFEMDRRQYLKNKEAKVENFCIGKCRRQEENTRGVKENIIRRSTY